MGVPLISFKYALPTITASAPPPAAALALTYLFTSSGVEIPNPTPMGMLPFVYSLISIIACSVYLLISVLIPVVPKTATRYKNPLDAFAIFCTLDLLVFTDTRNMVSMECLRAAFVYSSDSSTDMSGRINPSIPAFLASLMNFAYPMWYKMLVYVISTSGISVSPRISFTTSKKLLMSVPFSRDAVLAS